MNWSSLRHAPWLDTRARFVAASPPGGALLDLGSSDGETLRHFSELRPDLRLHAVDLAGQPDAYPAGCQFERADLEKDRLPWPAASMDRVTCMHLVEHLNQLENLFAEIARLLKPGGRVYLETPHEISLRVPTGRGTPAEGFTLNFYDDATHTRLVPLAELARHLHQAGLTVLNSGISRNWLFAAAWPLYRFARPSRKKYTAQVHWLGWSAYCIGGRAA